MFTTIEGARREGFDTFMFTTETARAAFAAERPEGLFFVDEFHSRGDVFPLFCLAFRPRAGVCTFTRGGDYD